MTTAKVERLLNLVIALLSTRGYLTADKIRTSVAGYDGTASTEAFARMFERDKTELRELGIPLETGRNSASDVIEGYRIDRGSYALPDIALSGEEAAAVAVATRLWQTPELIAATRGALLKLRAAGVDVDPEAHIAIAAAGGSAEPRGSEGALGAVLAAVQAGQVVQFAHRSSRTEDFTIRTVEPWGAVTAAGRWYLVGHDRDRDATRVFRLSRIDEPVGVLGEPGAVVRPAGVDPRALVTAAITDRPTGVTAVVWVAADRATALRRAGTVTGAQELAGRAGELVELQVGSTDRLVCDIAGYGADAVVLSPPELRAQVLDRLAAHLEEQNR